jgi:predicted amidohydrolase
VEALNIRVASVAWKLRTIRSDGDYFGHLHDLISFAHGEGAQVVVLPELHVLELLSIERNLQEHQSPDYLVQYAEALEQWLERIATSSGMTIIGGSHFKKSGEEIKNVCAIARPNSTVIFAEKNNLTRYEREVWKIAPGEGLTTFDPGIGINVCYDSEFPEAGRALAEAGCQILAVPAWTETVRGYQRVRWSCQARAIENQFFVVHASLVGGFGYEPVPESYGNSSIIAPSVEPFREEAILRESEMNEEGVVVADLNLEALMEARQYGEVQNWTDRHSGRWDVTHAPTESA